MFLGVDRDKSGRIGFFGSSGGTSGFGLQIGTVPTRSGRLASFKLVTVCTCKPSGVKKTYHPRGFQAKDESTEKVVNPVTNTTWTRERCQLVVVRTTGLLITSWRLAKTSPHAMHKCRTLTARLPKSRPCSQETVVSTHLQRPASKKRQGTEKAPCRGPRCVRTMTDASPFSSGNLLSHEKGGSCHYRLSLRWTRLPILERLHCERSIMEVVYGRRRFKKVAFASFLGWNLPFSSRHCLSLRWT